MQVPTYYLITLHPDVEAEAFEQELLGNVLPELQVLQRNVRGTSHALYKRKREGDTNQYLWVLTVDLIGGVGSAGIVGDLPSRMRDALKPYGTLSPASVEVEFSEAPASGGPASGALASGSRSQ